MIATAATVIASQAVISGVFSVTTQAVSLDYCRACASSIHPRSMRANLRADHDGSSWLPRSRW